MATDKTAILFDYKELVTDMVRKREIHDGIWALYVEFGIVATNMEFKDPTKPNVPIGQENAHLFPTAIVPIQKIGIVRTQMETAISVDASKVNPKAKSNTARKTPKKKV